MSACCCILAGTTACQHCHNNPFATDLWTNTVDTSYVVRNSVTNADRIRSMTDEELCDEYFRILNYQLYNYTDSRAGLLCWLKEEVKDGE